MALMNDKLIEEMVFYRGLISVFDEIANGGLRRPVLRSLTAAMRS